MKLLEQVRHVARAKHLAYRTEQAYAYWIERYIRFHGIRHPNTMGAAEVEAFLTSLAVEGRVAASTQNQALEALLFLYRNVLQTDIGNLNAVRARRPQRVPVVLSRGEVARLLTALDAIPTSEPYALMARLMYGAGLRLMECCRLRMKDVDLDRGQLTIRAGKGDKDRFVRTHMGTAILGMTVHVAPLPPCEDRQLGLVASTYAVTAYVESLDGWPPFARPLSPGEEIGQMGRNLESRL